MFFHFLLGNSTNKYFILWVEKKNFYIIIFFTSNIIKKYFLNAAFYYIKIKENSYSTLIIQLFFLMISYCSYIVGYVV